MEARVRRKTQNSSHFYG